MIVSQTVAELRARLAGERRAGRSVGFVPTMGALHAGHLSLVERARRDGDVVVVSIFVNPAQFGPNEDFAAYPRTLAGDVEKCASAGVDVVFAPPAEEIYPGPSRTRVSVEGLTERMEGEFRPGHLDGVALVVTKLFNIVGECRAYFGRKDAQQLRVVRQMARDLSQPVEVVACPTVRDQDGLALSSRNAYLSPDERGRSLVLSRALRTIAERAESGVRSAEMLLDQGRAILADGADSVDYLEIVDPDTLEPLDDIKGQALVCAAIRIGRTRLIDNVEVDLP